MSNLNQLKELKNVNRFDFTIPEKVFIIENANFTEEQEKIFEMLTGKYGRESIVYIAFKMNMSESTVKRRIKQIKNKIIRLL